MSTYIYSFFFRVNREIFKVFIPYLGETEVPYGADSFTAAAAV